MSKHQFQTEVTQLLNLMINSLYSNKEIFLRELISNSSDAIDKLNYLSLTDENYKNLRFDKRIDIKIDKEAKTLTISDGGIGMNEEDLVENLGTIAKSGTKSFVNNLTGDAKKDSQMIGQFGVGFYSGFMVADKIEVISKKAGESKAHIWTSSAGADYEIAESTRETSGTSIKLYIKDDESEFLEEYRLESIITKYSNHIPFPIFLEKEVEVEVKGEESKEGEDKETQTEIKIEQVNKASALWRMNKSDIKKDEYVDFYKTISHDSTDPIMWTHTKAEGTLEYSTLFYVPSTAPFDMYRVDFQPGVKLYVKRVFITDDEKELLPTYLRFVKGIIDAEDLPLNISREILQQNLILSNIKKASVKKILNELKKLKNKDNEKYQEFYKVFGKVMKEGLYSDFENKDKILDLVQYKSTKSDTLVDLDKYKEGMGENQKEIYYITGEDELMLKNSPLIEKFKAKDIEVLIMDDDLDGVIMPMVTEYKGTPVKSVKDAELEDTEEEKEKKEETKAESKVIVEKIKEALKDEVKDVKISERLNESPACIVFDKSDPDFQMQQMMKQMGQNNLPEPKPILEINANHEIITKIANSNDGMLISDISHLLLDQARMIEGMKLDNFYEFSKRMNKIISKAI